MAYMIARGNGVKRRIDTGGMTKFDWRSYCGIESIYKMTTSMMNCLFATLVSVHTAAPCLILIQYLSSVMPVISKPTKAQRTWRCL